MWDSSAGGARAASSAPTLGKGWWQSALGTLPMVPLRRMRNCVLVPLGKKVTKLIITILLIREGEG